MDTKHGIYPRDPEKPIEDLVEFWWAGERVYREEFNRRSLDQMRAILKDANEIMMGMDLQKAISKGEKTSSEIDLIEEILKAPLCEVCRMMIENMKH